MQTIIILRAAAGTGKTAVQYAMEHGQRHLLGIPLLCQALDEGWAMLPLDALVNLIAANESILPAVQGAIGEKPFLLADPCVNVNRLVEACSGQFRLIRMWLMAPDYIVSGRREVRWTVYPDTGAQAKLEKWRFTTALLQEVLGHFEGLPVERMLVDTSDYPLREITTQEAYDMVERATGEPTRECDLLSIEDRYQKALWIRGVEYGDCWAERSAWERGRLDLILPADLTGKTVLDLGASEGGFCYEALHRGAIYATAIESRDSHVALMRRIRDAWQLPMTVAQMDVVNESLPVLTTHGPEVMRYGVGLLLNVLHHCKDPKALLEKVLAVCDAVVIETPFTSGCEPRAIDLPPYPYHLGLPPEWVKRIGAANGFALESIRISSMMEGQRLLYNLRRLP